MMRCPALAALAAMLTSATALAQAAVTGDRASEGRADPQTGVTAGP